MWVRCAVSGWGVQCLGEVCSVWVRCVVSGWGVGEVCSDPCLLCFDTNLLYIETHLYL